MGRFDNIKFRASSVGRLMIEPQKKSEALSETTKKYLIEAYIHEMYRRKKDISSKYLEKGTTVEEDSITLYSRFKGVFLRKNERKYEGAFFSGTPDCVTDIVIDFKSSWDIFTFFDAKFGKQKPDYYWQMQVYMHLTGLESATLAYCLVNTPTHLVKAEQRKLLYKVGDTMGEAAIIRKTQEIERNMTFDDIAISERVHEIEIKRNESDIDRLIERVKQCREYMNQNFQTNENTTNTRRSQPNAGCARRVD